MRAILIDPTAKTVTEVEHDGSLADLYRHIQCEMVEAVGINGHDYIYVDEEGRLKAYSGDLFFHRRLAEALVGRGLIVGVDNEGDNVEPYCTLEQAMADVSFLQ